MEVYLLVNHEQQKSKESESWTYVRLSSEQKSIRRILSDTYRSMPDPMQLTVLLSVYDALSGSSIASLLECKQEVVSRLLENADKIFSRALGQNTARESIYGMLENEIENHPLFSETVERVRNNLRKILFDTS